MRKEEKGALILEATIEFPVMFFILLFYLVFFFILFEVFFFADYVFCMYCLMS